MSDLLRNKHGDLRNSGYYQNLKLRSHFWPGTPYPAKSLYLRNGLSVERNGACFFQHNHNPELAIEMVLAGAVVYEDNGVICHAGPGEGWRLENSTWFTTTPKPDCAPMDAAITGNWLSV